MDAENKESITIESVVNAPIDKAWKLWTEPEHIKKWNNASPDWHMPIAKNDLKAGGKFISRMEAIDGSFGFDYEGVYDKVKTNELISYTLGDSRKVEITFSVQNNKTKIVETFEAESINSIEMQRGGWQSILDNFPKLNRYVVN